MNQLTPKEFDSAIHKGLGRAYLHVKQYGDNEIRDILLNSCLRSFVYDTQSEGTRSDWLLSIINLTNNMQFYEDAIVSPPADIESLRDADDTNQRFDLLMYFAEQGSKQARKTLYNKFDEQMFNESWIGGRQIIELDGISGFLHIAETIGKRLKNYEDYWEDDSLLANFEEQYGEKEIESALEERAKVSENVQVYLKKLIRQRTGKQLLNETLETEKVEEVIKKNSLEQIIIDIEDGNYHYPYQYMKFGQAADDKDISEIFNRLKNETREAQLERLLWIFIRRTIPELDDKLFKLAVGENNNLRSAAISALSNVINDRINELAHKILLQDDWHRAIEALELLVNNFQQSDKKIITNVIKRIPESADTDECHDITTNLIDICKQNISFELLGLLIWIYENSPCMYCRHEAVKMMIEHKIIPNELLEECLYDGYKEIRELANSIVESLQDKT